MSDPETMLDVRGMCCPMPLIKLQKAVATLAPAAQLRIIGDDPVFEESIVNFCTEHPLQITSTTRQEREVTITLRRSP